MKTYSLLISLAALILSISSIVLTLTYKSDNLIDLSHFLNLISTIATCTAFLVGCYFATLAVQGYEHVKDLEARISSISEKEKKIDSALEKNSENENRANLIFSDYANTIDLILGYELDVLNSRVKSNKEVDSMARNRHKQVIDDVYKCRIRLCYLKELRDERRESFLIELGQYGDFSDLSRLQEIINDKSESQHIITLATGIHKILIKKLNNQTSSNNNII